MKDFPISSLTEKEQAVLSAIVSACCNDYCADLADVVSITGFAQETAKGVIGSLVKKGHVLAEEEKRGGKTFFDLFAVFNGERLSWGGESSDLKDEDFELIIKIRDWPAK